MRSSTLSRRVLGLAAAGVLGLSTLALPGVALADDSPFVPPIITIPVFPPLPTVPLILPPLSSSPATSSPSSEPEILAAVPASPYLNYADAADSSLVLDFTDSNGSADAATSYEATTDGGTTWVTLTGISVAGGRTTGTLPGLVNGTTYTVAVRGSNSAGHGSASNTTTGTPRPVLAAPTAVVATPGPGSLRVTWDAPAGATGWTVSAVPAGAQSDQDLVLCEVAGTARACTLAVPAGQAYEVGVRGSDANGSGQAAFVVSGVVPAATTPTAVPTQDDGDLKGPSGAITAATAGQQLVLRGDGYLPGSTVKLTVFSTPVDLGSVVVASDGTFSATVTIPANLANGTHHLVATGVDANGNARNLVITVTVSGGVATLATTGFDAVPVALGGGLVLLAGGGLLVGARRRSTNA